jgi:predicted membrane-bound spermidine synthase
MLFGNGLSALLTLIGISVLLVALFVGAPLLVGGARPASGWSRWLLYFGSLGAGFMLLEVALLQRFVLLLGHPVYSLTVTLFSLLVGTGTGSFISRRVDQERLKGAALRALATVVVLALLSALALPIVIDYAIAWPLPFRLVAAAALLVPGGVLLGVPLPTGMRLVAASRPEIIPWGWGMNGALSVLGAAAAVFLAMNWGFFVTLSIAALTYGLAAAALAGTKSLISN